MCLPLKGPEGSLLPAERLVVAPRLRDGGMLRPAVVAWAGWLLAFGPPAAAGPSDSSWLSVAVQRAPAIRQAFQHRESLEHHRVSPLGVVDDGSSTHRTPHVLRRRRMNTEAPELCPNDNGLAASYGSLTLTDENGANVIRLYNDRAGYSGGLFCQWNLQPTGRSDMSIIFDKFDVPVGFDIMEVYLMKCEDIDCRRRLRSTLLSWPKTFDEVGQLPPLVSASEGTGNDVHVLLRFTSKYSSGATGFLASCARHVTRPRAGGACCWSCHPSAPCRYTSVPFDLMEALPALVPQRLGTQLAVSGAGFESGSQLYCVLQAKDLPNDAALSALELVVNANPPESTGGRCTSCAHAHLHTHMAHTQSHHSHSGRLTDSHRLQICSLVSALRPLRHHVSLLRV